MKHFHEYPVSAYKIDRVQLAFAKEKLERQKKEDDYLKKVA